MADKANEKRHRKAFSQRREELRQALYRIGGAVDRYKATGEVAEIGAIAVELRILLCDSTYPLLLALAREKGFPLEVYTFPEPDLTQQPFGTAIEGMTHGFSGDSVSLTRQKPWTHAMPVDDWLHVPIAEVVGVRRTPESLIKEVANKHGPAHYDRKTSEAMQEMKTMSLAGVPSYFRTLFTFAEVVHELGVRFLDTY